MNTMTTRDEIATPRPTEKKSVLFVDDDPFFLMAFGKYLSRYFQVDLESDPMRALERIKEHGPYPVVVSDIRMPGMDGLEFLAKVSEMDPNTATIVLTSQADLDTAMEAVNDINVFGFFSKNCEIHKLVDKIGLALKRYGRLSSRRLINSLMKVVSKEEMEFLTS